MSEAEAGRISGAELRVWLDWLGLSQQSGAAVLGVRPDTVRRWVAGRDPIPIRVGDELDAIETATGDAVDQLVTALQAASDPGVLIYRSDADLWAARPELRPYPTGWWRMVVARATSEVPGVEIDYADERGAA